MTKLPLIQNAARLAACLIFLTAFSPSIQAQGSASAEAFANGMTLYQASRFDEAAKAFKEITDRDPSNAEAYFYLANSYFQMSRNKEAVKAYERTIKLKPDHYLAYNNLGTAHHRAGKFREAIASYKEALRIKPNYAEAIFGLGVAYLELKEIDAALEQHKLLAATDVERADKLYAYITNQKIPLKILNGKAVSLPSPFYPGVARQQHVSGKVLVWILIDEKGKVVSASAVAGHPLLRPTAVQAATLAEFTPTVVDGKAVRVTGIITYNFGPINYTH